jgi:hypothetical protein
MEQDRTTGRGFKHLGERDGSLWSSVQSAKALVGDMNDVEPAGHLLEHLDGDMRDRAGPARAIRELAWIWP